MPGTAFVKLTKGKKVLVRSHFPLSPSRRNLKLKFSLEKTLNRTK